MSLTNQNENIRSSEKDFNLKEKTPSANMGDFAVGARTATEFEHLAQIEEEMIRKNYYAAKQDLLRAGNIMFEAGKKKLDPSDFEMLKQLMLKVCTKSV